VLHEAKEVGSQLATVLKSQHLVILWSERTSKKSQMKKNKKSQEKNKNSEWPKKNKNKLPKASALLVVYSRARSVCEAKKKKQGEGNSAIYYSCLWSSLHKSA
jgi:hypothetical protein